MIPYWKRVPIDAPKVLMELDPTNKVSAGWCNDGAFRDMCNCNKVCEAPFPKREDPFDFYEDALGG